MTTRPQWGRASDNFTFLDSRQTKLTDVCVLTFTIPNDIKPPILMYYRLTNFYQNHRRYVKSLDIEQLKGKARSAGQLRDGDCDPLDIDKATGKPYYPCGLIANSMFNDSFSNLNASNVDLPGQLYNLSDSGIAWGSEGDLYKKSEYGVDDVVPPPNWKDRYENGNYSSLSELPNIHTWEAFQVWMRTAGLPTFSKLARRNDKDVLKQGTYRLKIYDSK